MFDLLLSKTTIIEILILLFFFFALKNIFFVFFLSFLAALFYKKLKYSKLPQSKEIKHSLMSAAFYSLRSDNMFFFGKCRVPKIAQDQILVKVCCSSINPFDILMIIGYIPFYRWFEDHRGVGIDFSGIIIDKGANVTRYKVGDEIFGRARDGSIQEFTYCYENDVVLKPKNITFAQAAALTLAGMTSYQAMNWFGSIEGKEVLIIGASGGTGHFGVQIAKYCKAKKVIGVCSSANAEYVKGLGADEVIEYNKENAISVIGDMKFDLIYDTVTSLKDPNQEEIYRKYLKPNGKYVSINGNGSDNTKGLMATYLGLSFLERKDYHFHVLNYGKYEDMKMIRKMAEEGKLIPFINEFAFDKKGVIDAFDKLKSRRVRGKVVINIENNAQQKKQI